MPAVTQFLFPTAQLFAMKVTAPYLGITSEITICCWYKNVSQHVQYVVN